MKIQSCVFKNQYSFRQSSQSFEKNQFGKFTVPKNIINCAVEELNNLSFDKNDLKKFEILGGKLIFKNGKEAVDFSKKNNIKIDFDKMENPSIHAQWSEAQNKIIINNKYKNTNKIAEILAIASSILHELSHAKDNDSTSSIQEEIDCLGMNSLAHSAFSKKYKNVFLGQQSPIIKDGVELYANLYFNDKKENLIKRISKKYGNLPVQSPNHNETPLAKEIKFHYQNTNKTI